MSWKKAIVVFCGVAAIPASIFAGAIVADLADRHLHPTGQMWSVEGGGSFPILLHILPFALVFLVPIAAILLRVYRKIESAQNATKPKIYTNASL
jgi:hypothetical protein